MAIRISGLSGCATVLLVLFGPALLVAYLSHSLIWLIVMPFATILVAFVVAASKPKRKLTPDQFADRLEKYLLNPENEMDWDDVMCISVADERLERILWQLWKLDSEPREKQKEELKAVIAAIRRGDLPEVVPPKFLTYNDP
jgi:hypothetical protein